MGHRRRARECALQLLYQIDQTGVSAAEAFEHFWQDQDVDEEQRGFAESLVQGVVQNRDEMDSAIRGAAEHWRLERMAVVDRNVLRLAVFEMLHQTATPAAVVIDEAIEVSKKFGSEGSGNFINGILDAIRRSIESGEI